MVELTTATGRAGFKGCFEAATDVSNIPTYAGIGTGLIVGNVVGKEFDKLYSDKIAKIPEGAEPTAMESFLKFTARSAGRLVASAGLCALSGSLSGDIQKAVEASAIGSAGMIAVDVVKTYAPDPIGGYADLQSVPMRRYVNRTALQEPAAGRVRSVEMPKRIASAPNGGIVGGKPQQVFSSGRVGGK